MNFIAAAILALQDIEQLQRDIESMKPAKLAWHEIAWRECPLEALREAREKKKPVIAWVFLGTPSDERC